MRDGRDLRGCDDLLLGRERSQSVGYDLDCYHDQNNSSAVPDPAVSGFETELQRDE